jgi:hypothetical protein
MSFRARKQPAQDKDRTGDAALASFPARNGPDAGHTNEDGESLLRKAEGFARLAHDLGVGVRPV